VYNKALETRKNAWEERQEAVSKYDTINLIPQWKAENEWLKDGHAQAMQEALTRLDLAFRSFFRRVKAGEKPGYPRFRSADRYDSFTYPQERGNWRFLDNGRVRLSKIGDVKIKLHRPLSGECKTLTIQRDAIGNWYACFSCIVEANPLIPTDKIVGIDVGLTHFATLSDGSQIDNPRFFRKSEDALVAVQRHLSKETKGTPGFHHYKRVLNHIHQRIANRRKNFAHQESRKLIDKYQLIAFEDLDINGMMDGNHRGMNKSICDVAWNQFVQFTTSKAEGAGRRVVLVDPRNTTKLCSRCGEIVPKKMSVRVHVCPKCDIVLDRDHNAALNILARGLAGISTGSPVVAVEAPALAVGVITDTAMFSVYAKATR
jgi:putative transposase